jgi:signal transduction histidine kinase
MYRSKRAPASIGAWIFDCKPKQVTPMHNEHPDPAELRVQLTQLLQEHDRLAERLREGQTHFRRIARSVWRVQEEERGRFARELHDGVGHNLTAMLHLLAGALASLPAGAGLDRARSDLARVQAVAESTLQDTRALSRLLRPQILDDLGLEPALRWLVRSFSETHESDVTLDYQASSATLDRDRSTLVFRIAQEALANIARHSSATRVDVIFTSGERDAELSVRDNGRGCVVQAALERGSEGGSSGLGGMRDRARLFGGTLRVDSAPGAGFVIRLRFALTDSNMEADA